MVVARLWQKAEGAIIFAAGILLFTHFITELPWWLAIIVFFAPDLSFAAYLAGPKVGAMAYNFVHIYAFGLALLAIGMLTPFSILAPLGALWLAHSGFDRLLGYGLKSPEGFSTTHMGPIGPSARR